MSPPAPSRLDRRVVLAAAAATAAVAGAAWAWRPRPRRPDVVTPQQYGAAADGVADDTEAVRAAIASGAPVLHFPAGHYRLSGALRPASGQSWVGDGPQASVLMHGGAPDAPPFNLVHVRGTIEDFTISALGFRGNRPTQRRRGRDGQGGFAIYLRGVQRRITVRDCDVALFGDGGSGGGGVAIGPLPSDAEQDLAHIRVENCSFANNGNVPGIYVAGGGPAPESIFITGNRFTGTAGSTTVQNAVYVLGWNRECTIRRVEVSRNLFDFATPVDTGIELNWVEGFAVADNVMTFRAALDKSSAVLLRDGCAGGTVTGNAVTNTSPEPNLHGIVLLNFKHPAGLSDIVVAGNSLTGIPKAIAVDRGARGVVVSGNRIAGGLMRGSYGVRVVDAQEVTVTGNLITDMAHGVELGTGVDFVGGLAGVEVVSNTFIRCGDADTPVIAEVGVPGSAAQARIADNRGLAPPPPLEMEAIPVPDAMARPEP